MFTSESELFFSCFGRAHIPSSKWSFFKHVGNSTSPMSNNVPSNLKNSKCTVDPNLCSYIFKYVLVVHTLFKSFSRTTNAKMLHDLQLVIIHDLKTLLGPMLVVSLASSSAPASFCPFPRPTASPNRSNLQAFLQAFSLGEMGTVCFYCGGGCLVLFLTFGKSFVGR